MSTQRPQPELSAYFIREKRILKAADTAKYNARLKEIDLPDDYAIYGYEPSSGRKPAAYWVCKQSVGECPECGTPYLEDAIASVSESKLTHYCRVAIPHEGEKPTYDIHPATLYLRRIRWMCYNCYSKLKTYNAKMQDDSQLVDEKDRKLTLQLKKYLGQQAMHMEINTLAEIFDISPHTVKKCFDKALAEYEKRRNWDDISTLGLYTVTLNVQGQQTNFCLCADVDTESLIELFAYEDKEAAANFLSKLKNKQNIQRVFISIDSAAFNFAKTNFPIKTIMVDRLDVRKRLLNGLETVKKGNDDSQDFPILRRHWKLLKNVEEAIPANSKDYVFLKEVLNAFPHVGDAYWLKEAGMDIYRKTTGQCKLVSDWISSDKYNILPYEQLEQYMIQAQEPVVRFAVQYNGVDRSRYEKAILEAESPLINYVGLTSASKSALWSRAASFKIIRARVLYGAAMMANYFAAQEPNEKSHEEYAIHEAMCFATKTFKTIAKINEPVVEAETTQEIYVWILSKNKRPERKGYVQLIDATSIFHKLRKAAGNKRNELLPEDRSKIVKLYTAFEENEYCKIFKNEEFMYREYTVMQPLQRSYAITEERIQQMLADGTLNSVYDPAKVDELEEQGAQISVKDKMKLDKLYEQKPVYEAIISVLQDAVSDEIYLSPEVFMPVLRKALAKVTDDKKLLDKIADGLSVMDKNAEIQRDKHGAILYDKDSKDTERVPYEESIDDYMAREVLPHVPDAKAFWEEKVDAKKPVIKTGAEIPFTQYFYKYEQPVPSEELAKQFMELEQSVSQRIAKLFG